jgi:hypothetical protein
MAFALSKAYFYKLDTPSHVRKWGLQVAEFHVTRLNTDTALDLGNPAGTFWSAVGASGIGVPALAQWRVALTGFESLVSCEVTSGSGFLLRVASGPTAAQYALTNSSTYPAVGPSLTLNSGGGPTDLKVILTLALEPETRPVEFGV